MKKRLFSRDDIDVLSDTKSWRFISSSLPAEVEPVSQPEHEAWAAQHVDAHPLRETLFVLSGSGYERHCGKTYPAEPGMVFMFDSMEPHNLSYPDTQPPARHLLCQLYENAVGLTLISANGNLPWDHCRRIWYHSYSLTKMGLVSPQLLFPIIIPGMPADLERERCVAAWDLLFMSVLADHADSSALSRGQTFQRHAVESMIEYIEVQKGRDCSLEHLAQLTGYSRCHFSRMFHAHTGMSIRQCVNAVRARALRDLLEQHEPLKRIAHELGFAHASALCRWRRQQAI